MRHPSLGAGEQPAKEKKGKISVFALQGKNPAPGTHIFVKKTGKDEFTPCIPMDTYGRIAGIE